MSMASVLTYLCTLCFLSRAKVLSSDVQYRKCRNLPFTCNCLVTSAPWGHIWCPGSGVASNPDLWLLTYFDHNNMKTERFQISKWERRNNILILKTCTKMMSFDIRNLILGNGLVAKVVLNIIT